MLHFPLPLFRPMALAAASSHGRAEPLPTFGLSIGFAICLATCGATLVIVPDAEQGSVLIALLAMISVLALGYGLAFRSARPGRYMIAALARATERVSEGDRSVRVDKGRMAGPLADLVDQFNQLAEVIDRHEADRRVLTAGITHELRTPLTILKGRLHAIEDRVLDPRTGETREMLRQIDHILRMVEDLGTLAHAELGQLALEPRMIDLRDILRPVLRDLEPVVRPHGIRFSHRYAPARVVGDPVRLTQIVTNLLTNAVKHSPAGGTISVTISIIGTLAVIGVFDEGAGFAPSDTDNLFAPFWRSAATRKSGRPGSGIGLALAATLAEKHGGHIKAENRSDRSGACFSLWLPLAGAVRNDIRSEPRRCVAASASAGGLFDS